MVRILVRGQHIGSYLELDEDQPRQFELIPR